MIHKSPSKFKKFAIVALSLVLAVALTSCSKGKKNAEPAVSASISSSASPSASASVKPSKKPNKKPAVENLAKPKYKPLVPSKPLAKKPYIVKVAPTPEPTLTKSQKAFEAALKKQLGLDRKSWNTNFLEKPLDYKMSFLELADYTKGFLCSYIQTGADDFTLGQYLSGEVSWMQDVQTGVVNATKSAYGCKPL